MGVSLSLNIVRKKIFQHAHISRRQKENPGQQQKLEFEESGEKLHGFQPEVDCLKLSPPANYFGGSQCIQLIPDAFKLAMLNNLFGSCLCRSSCSIKSNGSDPALNSR